VGTKIVDDCWSYSAILRRILDLTEAGSYMRARGGGSIGWGLPGSLGVKLAAPENPVICVSGDGSALWSIQSLWTAAHYQIPVTFVICANSIYRQVRVMKSRIMGDQVKGRDLGTDISAPRTDFVGIARSFGIQGARVEKPDEIGRALKAAIGSNRPYLVEVGVEGKL
jgi:benzoylformate decarboxylase